MQEYFRFGTIVEISRFTQQHEVGHERRSASYVLTQLRILVNHEAEPAESPCCREHKQKRWEYPIYPSAVELQKAKTTSLKISEDDAGYEKSGDHEKYVNPDKTATHQGRKCMENDNG
ncbi:hypothetical protein D3C76_1034450 [compost metagenome]